MPRADRATRAEVGGGAPVPSIFETFRLSGMEKSNNRHNVIFNFFKYSFDE